MSSRCCMESMKCQREILNSVKNKKRAKSGEMACLLSKTSQNTRTVMKPSRGTNVKMARLSCISAKEKTGATLCAGEVSFWSYCSVTIMRPAATSVRV